MSVTPATSDVASIDASQAAGASASVAPSKQSPLSA